jgi:hypothetical protein
MRSCRVATVTLTLLGLAARAAADPTPVTGHVQLSSGATCRTDGGSDIRLPVGHFLDEPVWAKLDAETKRLQTVEVRLTAENASLKASAASWQPGWYTLAGAFAAGIATTLYVRSKL